MYLSGATAAAGLRDLHPAVRVDVNNEGCHEADNKRGALHGERCGCGAKSINVLGLGKRILGETNSWSRTATKKKKKNDESRFATRILIN